MGNLNFKCSFVSGKGGVGKTSLAANFAWICGKFAKTALIDLDFQNQGATGLFFSKLPEIYAGAFEFLANKQQQLEPVEIQQDFYFVPCTSSGLHPNYSEVAQFCQAQEFVERLRILLQYLVDRFCFQILIIDCHGGLDRVSSAAHLLSDYTFAISEADRVSFHGTLELLEFYRSDERQICRDHDEIRNDQIEDSQMNPPGQVHLIVNRVPPKYRWDDLTKVYARVLSSYKSRLNLANEIILYIPEEGFIADSFGEYPFPIELAPRSVISQKLLLLVFKIFHEHFHLPFHYKPMRKLLRASTRIKIEKCVISAEARNVRTIIISFALVSIFYIFFTIVFTPLPILKDRMRDYPSLVILNAVFGLTVAISIIRASFGLMFYYRDLYNFRRCLLKATHSKPSIWQQMALVRLFLLKWGTAVVPVFSVLYILFFVVGVILLRLGI